MQATDFIAIACDKATAAIRLKINTNDFDRFEQRMCEQRMCERNGKFHSNDYSGIRLPALVVVAAGVVAEI